MRLANSKSRNEVGLDFVLRSMNLQTPFGVKRMKSMNPFMPGEEDLLQEEFNRVSLFMMLLRPGKKEISPLLQELMEVKDASYTIERSQNNVLTMVELFEIKNLLLRMEKIRGIMEQLIQGPPSEFTLERTTGLLDLLDPRGDRINTFYIYDEFSPDLEPLRLEKRNLEILIRKEMKRQKQELEACHGLVFTPKFECFIQKNNEPEIRRVKEIPELFMSDQDYMTVTYSIKPTEAVYEMQLKMDALHERLDQLEFQVREELSEEIGKWAELLLANCEKIGRIDFTLAKASHASDHDCLPPDIVKDHVLEFVDGRQLEVEEILTQKEKPYCPVSMSLRPGVSCITGANMGGKTVCLKLAGLVAMLAQYGFFVPCRSARIGLSSSVHLLIGDSQSLQRGLSSFGSEMEELKDVLDKSRDRAFILIDEIASGTNPTEGVALTKSVIDYLSLRPYISLITTHFDGVNHTKNGQNMQVVGLANADFGKLDKEIRYANRKERIEIVAKYMDYRLKVLDGNEKVAREAINIAKMLGLNEEIINKAKKHMEEDKG